MTNLKIDEAQAGCIRFRAPLDAVKVLKLQPFTAVSSWTARGNLLTATGQGWYWISRFDAMVIPVLLDLLDVERELNVTVPKVKVA